MKIDTHSVSICLKNVASYKEKLFRLSKLVGVAWHTRCWDRSLTDFYADWILYRTAIRKLIIKWTIFNAYVSILFCLHIYAWRLPRAQFTRRALQVATVNSFARELNLYTVIHRKIISLYPNSSVWLDTWEAQSWNLNLADFYASRRFNRAAWGNSEPEKGF